MALNWLNSYTNLFRQLSTSNTDGTASCCSDDKGGDRPLKVKDCAGFQLPLHYPRYQKSDYEKMEEWKLEILLQEYGLHEFKGSLDEKRKFAMGAFLWPDQF